MIRFNFINAWSRWWQWRRLVCVSAAIGVLGWGLSALGGLLCYRQSQRWAIARRQLRQQVTHIAHQQNKKAVSQAVLVRGKRYELQYRRYKRIEQQLHAVVASLPVSMRLRSVRLGKTGIDVKGEVKDAAVIDTWLHELQHRFHQRGQVSHVNEKGGGKSAFTASFPVASSAIVGQP